MAEQVERLSSAKHGVVLTLINGWKKMKNTLFKTCLTGIVLSVAGLANAEEAGGPVTTSISRINHLFL
jgi:hypothetical protein